MAENLDFLQDLKALIEIEYRCEAVMGDALKRDQLKFLYEAIREIYDSPIKPLLFPPESETKAYIMVNILPRLNTFRTLVYMHDIDRRKKKALEEAEKKRLEEEQKRLENNEDNRVEEGKEEDKVEEEEKKEEEELDPEELAAKIKEEERLKQEAEDAEFGRYYLWEGMVPEEKYLNWKNSADKIDGVNPHIIEDIQDYIITQSYKPETPEGKQELENVEKKHNVEQDIMLQSQVEEEKTQAKVDIKLDTHRPHKRIWNYFLEQDSVYFRGHKFRYYFPLI